MREILFRGKRIDNGEWIFGSLIHRGDYCCILPPDGVLHDSEVPYMDSDIGTFDGKAIPVDPETVGQYTGLTDKSGKRIFEGDILTNPDYPKYTTGAIYYGRTNCSCCDGVYGFYSEENADLRNADELTVIGNIYDNPELLEGKK